MKKVDKGLQKDNRKQRKKREGYSISDAYWIAIGNKSKKYKGRPKAFDYAFLKKAYEVVHGDTIQEWERELDISPLEYYELRELVIKNQLEGKTLGSPINIPKSFKPEAIKKMVKELNSLWWALGIFTHEVEKAKGKRKIVLSNLIREIFKDEAKEYIDVKKGKGANIRWESIRRANKFFKKWLEGGESLELPRTFYEREKLKGLCLLAYEIHSILTGPAKKDEAEIQRFRVIYKIRLLVEKFHIKPDDIFRQKNTAFIFVDTTSFNNLFGTSFQTSPLKKNLSLKEFIEQMPKRWKEVDEMLETLKDI